MAEIIQHPTYGEIVYSESFWTGKKSLTVNGILAKAISKNEFVIDETHYVLSGNLYTGLILYIGSEEISLIPKPKWYEIVLSLLPMVFLLTWGNSPSLCAIFPVVGGAIGGAIGFLFSFSSLLFMRKAKAPMLKVLIGVGAFVATLLVGFLLALLLTMLLLSLQ